jgi:NAD(P)-dependent dehydrogenase (short-subunit alcohol dehydrogenase family)
MAEQAKANKVALITGANKGIGLEIARQLGRNRPIILAMKVSPCALSSSM